MATDPLAGQGRARAEVAHGPGALRRFVLLRMASISYPGTEAEQLLLAPQDLRTADPSFATEIYNGHFGLAGSLVELNSQSPFEIAPPSEQRFPPEFLACAECGIEPLCYAKDKTV